MDLRDDHLSQLINALPNHFQFYHFGEVEMNPLPHPPPHSANELPAKNLDDVSAISFQIHGDIRAMLFLFFPKNLDSSLYSEMGNIIASRIATQLNKKGELEIMISPPLPVSEDQIKWVMLKGNSAFRRTYAHLYKNSVIPLETLVLPGPLEGIGYA